MAEPVDSKASKIPQPGDPRASQVPQPGDPRASKIPQPGDPRASQVPQPGDPRASQIPQAGDPRASQIPQPGDPRASQMPQPVTSKRDSDACSSSARPAKAQKGDISGDDKDGLVFLVECGNVGCNVEFEINLFEVQPIKMQPFERIEPFNKLPIDSIGKIVVTLNIELGEEIDITPTYDKKTKQFQLYLGAKNDIPLRIKADWRIFIERGLLEIHVIYKCSILNGNITLIQQKWAKLEALQVFFGIDSNMICFETSFLCDSIDETKININKQFLEVKTGKGYHTKIIKKNP